MKSMSMSLKLHFILIFHLTLDFDYDLESILSTKSCPNRLVYYDLISKLYRLRVNLSEVHNLGPKINETSKMASMTQTGKYYS